MAEATQIGQPVGAVHRIARAPLEVAASHDARRVNTPEQSSSALESIIQIAHANAGYVALRQARRLGLTDSQIRELVRRDEWQRVSRGLRRLTVAASDPWRDRIRQALLVAGPGAIAAGPTAAELLAIVGAPPAGPVWIAVSRDRHPQQRQGIRLLRTIVPAAEIEMVDGIPVTAALRALLDSARFGDPLAAVCLMESALRQGLVSGQELRSAIARIHGQSGSRRAATAFERTDPRSESPLETKARLLLLDADMPYPELQYPVAAGDERRIDLAYVAPEGSAYAGLAIEIDGRAIHAKEAAFDLDPRRQTALEEAAWLVRRFTAKHLNDREYVISTVRRALKRIDYPPE